MNAKKNLFNRAAHLREMAIMQCRISPLEERSVQEIINEGDTLLLEGMGFGFDNIDEEELLELT